MIRRFCDVCQKEIASGEVDNQAQLIHKTFESGVDKKAVHLELKITRAVNGRWNDGQVCSSCLREAVAEGTIKAVQS